MAAINFPDSPATNDLYTAPTGITYQWTGTHWKVLQPPLADTGYTETFLLMGG